MKQLCCLSANDFFQGLDVNHSWPIKDEKVKYWLPAFEMSHNCLLINDNKRPLTRSMQIQISCSYTFVGRNVMWQWYICMSDACLYLLSFYWWRTKCHLVDPPKYSKLFYMRIGTMWYMHVNVHICSKLFYMRIVLHNCLFMNDSKNIIHVNVHIYSKFFLYMCIDLHTFWWMITKISVPILNMLCSKFSSREG